MVGNWDREECRDNEEEDDERQLGSRLQVVEALIGGLGPGQDSDPWRVGKVDK